MGKTEVKRRKSRKSRVQFGKCLRNAQCRFPDSRVLSLEAPRKTRLEVEGQELSLVKGRQSHRVEGVIWVATE